MTPGERVKLTDYASCAGCAGKLPYGTLSRLLEGFSDMPAMKHPDLLMGAEHFSDAGVFRINDDLALVMTTDFFPPLVDDPFTFGQIAAANSLSDCYAVGGTPVSCLNIVCFPDKELPIEVLSQILMGGGTKVQEAGAVIVGGHSLRDTEIKYGLAVTGTVHPAEFLSNRGARPGDHLILTKPIGTGVLTSAAKTGKISQEMFAEAIGIMTQLNDAAGRVAKVVKAHGVTDITGYGLVGHAWEMAVASGATLEIFADSVPLLENTLSLARSGVLTRAYKSTWENIKGDCEIRSGVEEALASVLIDAQTSGGLLLSVSADDVADTLGRLRSAGVSWAAEIGHVLPKSSVSVILSPCGD